MMDDGLVNSRQCDLRNGVAFFAIFLFLSFLNQEFRTGIQEGFHQGTLVMKNLQGAHVLMDVVSFLQTLALAGLIYTTIQSVHLVRKH